jgi:hypothetical protein
VSGKSSSQNLRYQEKNEEKSSNLAVIFLWGVAVLFGAHLYTHPSHVLSENVVYPQVAAMLNEK